MKKIGILFLSFIVTCLLFPTSIAANRNVSQMQTTVSAEEDFSQIPYLLVYSVDSDEIIYNKNGEERIYPASITKVLTAIVALDQIADLNEKVTIDENDLYGLSWAGASVVGLQVGNRVSYSDLLYSLLIASAGDSAQTLANHLFGSQEAMVEAMNQKAMELGMNNSHFENGTGLHEDNHYSTAMDLLTLMKTGLNYEELQVIMSTMKYSISIDDAGTQVAFPHTIQMGKGQTETIENYITGGKTGSTIEAGSNLASFGEANGVHYIVIALKVNADENTFSALVETKKVYEYLESKYQLFPLWKSGEVIKEIHLKHTWQRTYNIVANKDIYRLIDRSLNVADIELQYHFEESYEAPLQAGNSLGRIDLIYQGEVCSSYEVTMDQEILFDQSNYYFEQLLEYWYLVVSIVILLSLFIYLVIKKRKIKNKSRYRL